MRATCEKHTRLSEHGKRLVALLFTRHTKARGCNSHPGPGPLVERHLALAPARLRPHAGRDNLLLLGAGKRFDVEVLKTCKVRHVFNAILPASETKQHLVLEPRGDVRLQDISCLARLVHAVQHQH